ncbi:hypothetical protein BGC39_10605 [Levilactobacillus brevis]|nr:hypothetical protein BGC39_10605 [Levilactobacillus brevis]
MLGHCAGALSSYATLQILNGTENLSIEKVTFAISVIALVVAVIGLILAHTRRDTKHPAIDL